VLSGDVCGVVGACMHAVLTPPRTVICSNDPGLISACVRIHAQESANVWRLPLLDYGDAACVGRLRADACVVIQNG